MLKRIADGISNLNIHDVGFGLVQDRRRIAALGNNPDVDIGAAEDIWDGGGIHPLMAAVTALEMLSSSASDGPAGTGARTVLINGLGDTFEEVSQTVTLDGTTPVALTTNLRRINNAFIIGAGSGEVNAGTLTIRDAGGGTTRAVIKIGYGITRQSLYTVPTGHTLSEVSLFACINRTGGGAVRYATLATFIRSSSGFYRMPFEFSISSSSPYRHDGLPGIILPEKTDFMIRCNNVTVESTDITAAWLGVLRKN